MRYRRIALMAAVSLLLPACAIAAPGQAASSEQNGEDRIVLPLELVAAEPATLAVLTADGHVAPGVEVVLSSGEEITTDESGRAHFLVPPETGPMFARIPGSEVREVGDVLPQGAGRGDLQVTGMPKVAALASPFVLRGVGFEGDADRNRIEIAGKRALVLASSPVQLVVMPSEDRIPGPASLVIHEGDAEVSTKVALVSVSSSSTNAIVRRGKKAEVIMLVRGTAEPVELDVRSLTPQVAQFARGDDMSVRTNGGVDNAAVIQLKGVGAGTFSLAINLKNISTSVNAPVARDFLEAARKMAAPNTANRLEIILKKLSSGHVDAEEEQAELQAVSTESSSRDFQALINAACRALGGE
jgi:hypothetical protein